MPGLTLSLRENETVTIEIGDGRFIEVKFVKQLTDHKAQIVIEAPRDMNIRRNDRDA